MNLSQFTVRSTVDDADQIVGYRASAAGGEGRWSALTLRTWLTSYFANVVHTHPSTDISDSSAIGRSLLTSVDLAAIKTILAYTKSDVGLSQIPNVDATNASNISSGTLSAARLPNPAATTLGGVKSLAAVAHQFLTAIGTDGSVSQAQPVASDISGLAPSATTDTTNAANISSGTLPAARLPNPAPTTLGGVKSLAAVATKFLTSIGTDGSVTQAQPAASDVSGLAASATTDTTNASNISSGTLAAARGGAGSVSGILKANGSGVVSAAVSGTDYAPATTGSSFLKGNGAGGFTVDTTNYVSKDATHLGQVGPLAFDSVTDTALEWSNLPVGYSIMFANTIGTVGGAPINNYGYFTKVANRDSLGGWGGLWVGYGAGENYFGRSPDSSTLATWERIFTTSYLPTGVQSGAITNAMLAGGITAANLVGTDIATVGTVTAGVWSATAISETKGGTNQTSYALGDILYASAANTLSKLSGNTTTTRQFLRQVGNGSASAAPAWDTVTKTDVGLSAVENTALSTWAGTSNITTLGTIATGTWSATAIAANKGGTGQTSFAVGDLLYASSTSALSRLAAVATGSILVSKGTSTAPAWATTVVLGDGTAGTPAYGFSGASGIGVYRSGSSVILAAGSAAVITAASGAITLAQQTTITQGDPSLVLNSSTATTGRQFYVRTIGSTGFFAISDNGVAGAGPLTDRFTIDPGGRVAIGSQNDNRIGLMVRNSVTAAFGYASAMENSVTVAAAGNGDNIYGYYITSGMTVNKGTFTGLGYFGIRIDAPSVSGTGSIGNHIALKIGDVTLGTSNNVAIETGLGAVNFGDNVKIASGKSLQLGTARSAGAASQGGTIQIKDSSGSTVTLLTT